MKWKCYPQYKDSGIEWLGEIPEDWKIFNLKRLAQVIDGDRGKEYPNENDLKDSGIPFFSSKNIIDNKLNYSNLKYISPEKFNKLGRGKLNEGDIILTVRGTIGSVGLFKNSPFETAFINAQMMIIRPSFHLESTYFSYFAISKSFFLQINASSYGAAQKQLSNEILSSIIIVIPPINEQKKIAAFLDRETTRIDKLIEKKEKQIELLKEKRAALISHAVTKGLDPNVKMKDSGIDWLGDIPQVWETKRLKYTVSLINIKVDGSNTELPFIGLEDIESWTGKLLKNNFQIGCDGQANEFKAGDVLFGKLRPYLAKVLRVKFKGICTGELLILRTKNISNDYIFYYLLSCHFINVVNSSTYGAKMPRASWDFIGDMTCLIPTQSEQKAISNFLDRETGKIDTLIEKVQKSIELLKEYRTAIISAAVTGKIDVRGTV
jgi:type I restriction enzyme S subunit